MSRILNCKPTEAHVKGQIRKKSTVYKTGGWLLEATDQEPCDLDRQVAELFSRVKTDIPAWARLSQEYETDLCCGIFMEETGEDIKISADTMKLLSERGIKLEICIYAPTPEVQMDAPCPCNSGKIYAECCAPKPKV